MQTFSINQIKQNAENVFSGRTNEPVLFTNDNNQLFLVMPITRDHWQDVFLHLYKSFGEINKAKLPEEINQKTMNGEEFLSKWAGVLENSNLSENWKEEYYQHLNEKYK